jgi:hypothetical protein
VSNRKAQLARTESFFMLMRSLITVKFLRFAFTKWLKIEKGVDMSKVFKLRQSALLCSIVAASLVACGGESATQISGAQLQSAPPAAPPAAPAESVSFSGIRNAYTITRTATGFAVKETTGMGTTVNVSATASLKFSDVIVNLAIGDKAKTISDANLQTLIELYIAFFNRVPDADGMVYWIGEVKNGMTVDALATSFYNAGLANPAVTGYTASMTNADFVKIIYKNVLGRTGNTAPPDEDVNYWAGELSSGRATKGDLVVKMLNSARTFVGHPTWGWVPQLLDNKVNVGLFFAIEQGLNYLTPKESIEKTMAIVAKITSSNIADAKIAINMLDLLFKSGAPYTPNGNGSGTGSSRDCYNKNLFKQGVTYSTEYSSKVTTLGTTTLYVVNYKPNGTVNFKGINAQELLTDTVVISGIANGLAGKIKSYMNVYDDESLYYGSNVTVTLPGFGDYTMIGTMTPPRRTPFSMAVNATDTQTYTTKQEASGLPFPMVIPDVTQTDKLTFLGIESVTVPAGTFSACKFKNESTSSGVTSTGYTWQIADANYRGLTAKLEAQDVITVATKLSIQGQ